MTTRSCARHSLLTLAICAGRLAAQSPTPLANAALAANGYSVAGTVADHEGNPIAGAEVALMVRDTATQFVRSDENGRFRLENLATAPLTLRVRRLGFRARLVPVNAASVERNATVFVTLDPMAAKLDAMKIIEDDDASTIEERLRPFYDRAQTNNFGRYITPEMLEKMHPQYLSEALRSVPGVFIKPSRRIGNIVRLRNCGMAMESPETVGPLIWLDGVRMPGAELDEVTQANDIAAMEIYNSFAGVPAQFFDRSAVCGTILLWSKAR